MRLTMLITLMVVRWSLSRFRFDCLPPSSDIYIILHHFFLTYMKSALMFSHNLTNPYLTGCPLLNVGPPYRKSFSVISRLHVWTFIEWLIDFWTIHFVVRHTVFYIWLFLWKINKSWTNKVQVLSVSLNSEYRPIYAHSSPSLTTAFFFFSVSWFESIKEVKQV